MQHKFLLRFIKQELEKAEIVCQKNEDFFKLFLPEEPWEAYRSNMSNWLSPKTPDGVIHKRFFVSAVNEKLGLSDDIWIASDSKQKSVVSEAVKRFASNVGEGELLFPWVEKVGITEAQEAFLDFATKASLEVLEDKVEAEQLWFKKSVDNQPFLIALFHLMYERGAYTFVYEHIFPQLLDSYDNSIKSKKADIYASLPIPMYREAFEILNAIKAESKEETIVLKTAAISNIRRAHFVSESISKEELKELLQTLIKCYTKIYTPTKHYNYYPGINLAYMVALCEILFPEFSSGYEIKQIMQDVQDSIIKGKASPDHDENYYASMSDLEFKLLLGHQGVVQELAYLLETLMPPHSMVNQSKRQMQTFFIEVVERFTEQTPSHFSAYKKCIETLDDYMVVTEI